MPSFGLCFQIHYYLTDFYDKTMLNIIDYFAYRTMKRFKGNPMDRREMQLVPCVVICCTFFIPFNLFYLIFRNSIICYISILIYVFAIYAFFDRRYKKYNNDYERMKFYHKYDAHWMNKYIPNWTIWVAGIALCPIGVWFTFYTNKLLIEAMINH